MALMGVVFWGGIWAITIVAILVPVLRERETQKTLRHAIEKGQTLDPATVESLLAPKGPETTTPAEGCLMTGVILIALGLGAMVLSWFIAQLAPPALYPILGGGLALTILGGGFVLLARLLGASKGDAPRDA